MLPKTVFMGSPDFALPALRALAGQYPIVGVVTQPDKPAGRGRELTPPPVKLLALELGLPVIQPERLRQPEAMAQLLAWQPELIVVAAFGQILRPAVLDLPRFGCINVHASLLPRWRGAAPIQAAILAGDEETGATIMRMDAGVDTGPLLSQRAIRIAEQDTASSLSERLAALGAALLIETLPGYLDGKIFPQPQETQHPSSFILQPSASSLQPFPPTYAPLLKKEDGLLDFSGSAEALARRVRAFNPWPGTFFLWAGQPLKVLRAHPVELTEAEPAIPLTAGTRIVFHGQPAVSTPQGLLILDEVQPAGKRPMPGRSFLAGARGWEQNLP